MLGFGRDCSYSLTHGTPLFAVSLFVFQTMRSKLSLKLNIMDLFLVVIATSTGVIRYSVVK